MFIFKIKASLMTGHITDLSLFISKNYDLYGSHSSADVSKTHI